MTTSEQGSAEFHQGQAGESLEKGEPDRAIAHFNQTIEQDPNCVPAFLGRGKAYLELGRYQKAMADFDRVLALKPKDKDAKVQKKKAQELLEIDGAIQDNITRDW